ncbi:MAG: DUF1015 domain-containing protein [Candidatus Omnitrophica bacterium]|nr:DUF1015 domain-containing protein [Candidatus Omnitrophota bacterium]
MAKIAPFSGVRFNTKITGSLAKIVCPPYDIINKQQRTAFMKQSKYNAVYIELPQGTNNHERHRRAKQLIDKWLDDNILNWDEKPSLYIYTQEFKIGKALKKRLGFISLLEIESDKKILPHEKIFNKFKFERFNLMKETKAHISPIFCIFDDNGKKAESAILKALSSKKPVSDICVDGIREKLWKIDDVKFINNLKNIMNNKKAFIADGHHRFQASARLRDYMKQKCGPLSKKQPYDYTLCYFVSMQDKGLVVLPTHRAVKNIPSGITKSVLVKKMSQYFNVFIARSKDELVSKMETTFKARRHAFGFFFENRYILAVLKNESIIKNIGADENCLAWKKLDVSILHYFILPKILKIKEKFKGSRNIYYYKGKTEAIKRVKAKEFKMAIFLNPTRIEEVSQVAKAGNKMPHKSTYFYPKSTTGLVIHKF